MEILIANVLGQFFSSNYKIRPSVGVYIENVINKSPGGKKHHQHVLSGN
jgi:hypothetical protein